MVRGPSGSQGTKGGPRVDRGGQGLSRGVKGWFGVVKEGKEVQGASRGVKG